MNSETDSHSESLDQLLATLSLEQRQRLLRTAHQIGLSENNADPLWRLLVALQWHLVLYESIPDRLVTVSNQLSERLRKENGTRLTGWRLVLFAGVMVAVGFVIGWQLSVVNRQQLHTEAQHFIDQPEGRLALTLMHHNDLVASIDQCREKETQFTVAGRRACILSLWLDEPPAPDRQHQDGAWAWLTGLYNTLRAQHPLFLFAVGFLLWPIARRILAGYRQLKQLTFIRWLFDIGP